MSPVTVEAVEIVRVGLPLVHPFRTVHGDLHTRDVLLVRVVTDAGEGWGEVSAFTTTGYTAETVDAAAAAIERFLAPALVARAPEDWRELRTRLTGIDGFPAARCGLEVALADARLRAAGTPLAADLGAVRDAVEVGVVVGFEADHGALLDRIVAASERMGTMIDGLLELARVLMASPAVVLLDEPAAGLDPRARVELRELLAVLATQNKAILISSHILTELTEICNGVVIVERGKLLESGTVAEVLKKSTPHRAFVIRVLGDASALVKELLQTPHVVNAREVTGEVLLELEGEEAAGCELLAALVGKGFKIAEFKQTKANLEDIFMNVTKGGVQ